MEIAFYDPNPRSGTPKIGVIASDGSGDVRTLADGQFPSWRPASRVAYVSDRDDDGDSEDANLYTVDSDGSDEKQITDGDAEDLDPDWKPQ